MTADPHLPPGWTRVPLGDLGTWTSGGTPPRARADCFGGTIPWVKTGDLPDGPVEAVEEHITETGLASSSARRLPPGTLIVAMYGATLGKLGILTQESATNQACAALIPEELSEDLTWYVFHFLRWRRTTLRAMGRGGAQRNLSQSALRALTCPLPPPDERRRITRRLDHLLEETRRARAAMDAATTLLADLEPRLLREAFPREDTPEVQGWRWTDFDALFTDRTHGQRRLPKSDYLASGPLPVIDQGASDVGGYTDRWDLAYEGPLPCVVFGDHTRRVKYLTTPFVQGAQGVRVLTPNEALCPRFAYWLLRAQDLPRREYGRHMKLLRARHFPVPPPDEQARVVAWIETALTPLAELKTTTSGLVALLEGLEETILSRAFRGRLVAPGEALTESHLQSAQKVPA